MTHYLLPALYALALWWAGTVLVMYLGGRPPHTFRSTNVVATLLMLAGVVGIIATRSQAGMLGSYVAVTGGVLIWAWLEVSFYTGAVTGPRQHPCETGCRGWRHFGHALAVSLYHELAILALGVVLVLACGGADNRMGLWTFLVLAGMHESARINVFLGVRNVHAEFLPTHMSHLASFLRERAMNPIFPVSIAVSGALLAGLVDATLAPGIAPGTAVGLAFVATMLALAVLEHILLVVPVPSAWLFRLGLRSRQQESADASPAAVKAVAGTGDSRSVVLR